MSTNVVISEKDINQLDQTMLEILLIDRSRPKKGKKPQNIIWAGCDRLETVILPPKVKAIPVDVFASCPSLSTIYVPKDRRKYYVSRFYTLEPSMFKSYVGPAPSLE